MIYDKIKDLNVGIYVRVSSESQVENGWSLEWQEERLKNIVDSQKLNLFSTYIEPGISGDDFEGRYSLLRMLSDVEEGNINCIVIFRVDRLSRSVEVGVKIASTLKKYNCIIYSNEYGVIDLNTPFGEQIYYNLIVSSSTEVKVLSARIKEGKRKSASKGYYSNSNGVYGYEFYYDVNTGARLLKINDYESEYISNIYDWYLNGISEYRIADKLNQLKIPTKRNGIWKASTIHSILTNQLFIGKIKYGTRNSKIELFNGLHPPIIDENKFYQVQELQKKRKHNKQRKMPSFKSYYSSLVICSKCGANMVSKQTKARDENSIRYYCKNKCGNKSIKHSVLDNMFAVYMSNLCDVNISDTMLSEYGKNNEILNLDNKILKYQNKLLVLENQFNEDCLSIEQYNLQIQRTNEKISDLIENRNKLIDNNINLNIIDREIIQLSFIDFSTIWNQIDSECKKNFVERFIRQIEIGDGIKNIILS